MATKLYFSIYEFCLLVLAALTLMPHPLSTSTPSPTPHPGAPPPQYSWEKDNVPLAGSTAFDISVARELRITNVQIIHNGTYRCTVQNKIGERLIGARSTIAQLFVIGTSHSCSVANLERRIILM